MTYLLNDDERHQLDEAWNDLFGAFDYHQANLRLLYEHFECRDKIVPDIERWPEHVKGGYGVVAVGIGEQEWCG